MHLKTSLLFVVAVSAVIAYATAAFHQIPYVVSVQVDPSVPCAVAVGAVLRLAGCEFVVRTDIQTKLASICSFEITNSCDYESAIPKAEGFMASYPVRSIDAPRPWMPSSRLTTTTMNMQS